MLTLHLALLKVAQLHNRFQNLHDGDENGEDEEDTGRAASGANLKASIEEDSAQCLKIVKR